MGLLDRVSTLIRANLNDLVDRAEDPSKMFKQVILDMENQLLQVKTQVAISIADQHMLEKKEQESREKITVHEAVSQAKHEMVSEDVEDRFAQIEREDEVDKLLAELKAKRATA